LFGGQETKGNDPSQGINYGGNIYLDEVRIYNRALSDTDALNLAGEVTATPNTLSLVTPSGNTQTITVTVPPSLVATSSVTITVTSDKPGVAVPSGAVGGVLTLTLSAGGANTSTFNIQANGPGTAHFSYVAGNLIPAGITTVTVAQPHINGLVAYWNFNQQNLVESSGFQAAGTHDGQAIGNVAYVPGLTGGYALDLRQPGTAVRIQNSLISDSNYRNTFDDYLFSSPAGFTIACWVRGLPLNNWCAWIAKDGESTGYQIRRTGDQSSITFTLRNSDGTDDPGSATAVITDNYWHHLAAVYDPVNFQRTLYIDGVAQLSQYDANLTLPPVNYPLFFGARDVASGNPFFANAVLDEVRIYDTALAAPDIQTLAGPPMVLLAPGGISLNAGDPDVAAITLTVPASLVATSSVSVTLTSANPAVAKPAGAGGASLTVNFAQGGNLTQSILVHAVGVGSTRFSATSPQAVVNGDTVVSVSPAPVLVGHWLNGAANLADTAGFRPAGTHDGQAIGSAPGNLAYSSDVPAGFAGQSLDLTAGNVAVAVQNSASGDAGYLPTFDTLLRTNFTIAFWAKGLPGWWSAWVSKDGDDNVGYQVRQYDTSGRAAFTIRGTPGADDVQGNVNLADTSVWHHYAAVWNGSQGSRQLYIDGQLDSGVNLTGDYAPFTAATSYHLVLGGQQSSGGNPNNAFAGRLYDVRVYNNALSPAGVQGLLVPSVVTTPVVLTVKPWTGNQIRLSWPATAT
ncbi:MAG TPA: LamG domain-containing protein, partial [Verrucomicrobiae bacterium]